MPEYDVHVDIAQSHHFAVDAQDPDAARAAAFALLGDRAAELTKINIEVERRAK